jgi:hypothetical protein
MPVLIEFFEAVTRAGIAPDDLEFAAANRLLKELVRSHIGKIVRDSAA